MQEYLYKHFYSDGHNGFLEDVTITLIHKTDNKYPKNQGNYWLGTLKMLTPDGLNLEEVSDQILYIQHIIIYKGALVILVGNAVGHKWN